MWGDTSTLSPSPRSGDCRSSGSVLEHVEGRAGDLLFRSNAKKQCVLLDDRAARGVEQDRRVGFISREAVLPFIR
jgi:hypothetical protein